MLKEQSTISQVNYAQNSKYFLVLSDLESSEIFINPIAQVSFNNREIIELFFTSILNRSLRVELVINSLLEVRRNLQIC